MNDKNKIVLWCDKIIVFSFYALIYFLPISTALVEVFSTFIITGLFVKRGSICFFGLREAGNTYSPLEKLRIFTTSFKPAANPLNLTIMVFLLINILSIIFSQYPGLSLKGFIFKLFQSIVLYFAFVECMTTKERLRRFMIIFFISITLILTNGVFQYFKGYEFIHHHPLGEGRVMSSFKHPNDFGGYLVIVFFIIFSLLFSACWPEYKSFFQKGFKVIRRRPSPFLIKLGLGVLFLAALGCLGYTFSRGAWMGFVVALIFMGIHRKGLFAVTIIVTVIFLIVFIPKLVTIRNVSFISDDVALDNKRLIIEKSQVHEQQPQKQMQLQDPSGGKFSIITALEKFGGMGRNGFWYAALSIIREFPVLGTGINTYQKVVSRYDGKIGFYPHNCYLQLTAETGCMGLLSFLWIIIVLFNHGVRKLKKIHDNYLSALLLGALAGLLGFLVHSFFDTNFYTVQLGNLMWITMALIIVIIKLGTQEEALPG